MRDYFLYTTRTRFSKWTEEDLPLAMQLWGDPAVTKYICAAGRFTAEEVEERLRVEMENEQKYHVQYYPFFERDKEELIGCCGLRPRTEGVYEVGFHLRRRYWGKGYATEAAGALVKYAFEVIGTDKLFAGHNPGNMGSGKVLEKLGFRCIGDEFYQPTGLYHPSYELFARK